MSILRTKRQGCFTLASCLFGQFVIPCDDPEAQKDVITQDDISQFNLDPTIPRIPDHLWMRWVRLAEHFVLRGNNAEVGVNLLLNDERTEWRIYVYPQGVSSGAVNSRSFDNSIDIETGEVCEIWPPVGWTPVGTSHSHNSMSAFYSGVDDRSELPHPGLHIVIGKIRPGDTYEMVASITGDMRRFRIGIDALVDTNLEVDKEITFHPDVLNIIEMGHIGTAAIAQGYTKPRTYDLSPWTPKGRYQPDSKDDIFFDDWERGYSSSRRRKTSLLKQEDESDLSYCGLSITRSLQNARDWLDVLTPNEVKQLLPMLMPLVEEVFLALECSSIEEEDTTFEQKALPFDPATIKPPLLQGQPTTPSAP